MLRYDGSYTIYLIQGRKLGSKDWFNISLDYFGHPLGFSASDKCWQKTGVMGCFDRKQAFAASAWLQKRRGWEKGWRYTIPNPPEEYEFRIIQKLMIQHTFDTFYEKDFNEYFARFPEDLPKE